MQPTTGDAPILLAAKRIAELPRTPNGYGVRSAVQARAVLADLDRQGLLDEASFSAAFATTWAPVVCAEQVRQFVAQVVANRSWLLTG